MTRCRRQLHLILIQLLFERDSYTSLDDSSSPVTFLNCKQSFTVFPRGEICTPMLNNNYLALACAFGSVSIVYSPLRPFGCSVHFVEKNTAFFTAEIPKSPYFFFTKVQIAFEQRQTIISLNRG